MKNFQGGGSLLPGLPQSPRMGVLLNKRLNRNFGVALGTMVVFLFLLVRTNGGKYKPEQIYPLKDDYEFFASSSFSPPSIPDAPKKDNDELCKSFPSHLLSSIQPVLKTGQGDHKRKIMSQMISTSACFKPGELLIFSDVDGNINNHTIFDVLATLPESHYNTSVFLKWSEYIEQKRRIAQGTLEAKGLKKIDGWMLDKFKFLPMMEQAWSMAPNKAFYVFYETDTYILWDNLFRLLSTYDPDSEIYMGSPSPGRRDPNRGVWGTCSDNSCGQGTWFANGGPGYVISRGAMKKLLERQVGPYGQYSEPSLSSQYSYLNNDEECCGDSVLGYVLWLKGIPMLGQFPMFTPYASWEIPFSKKLWCSPIVSLHKTMPQNMGELFKWEFSQRTAHKPITYADVWHYHKPGSEASMDDWENGRFDTYGPEGKPAESFEACRKLCEDDSKCMQFRFYTRQRDPCILQSSIQYGKPRPVEKKDGKEIRCKSGWMVDRIKQWKSQQKCGPTKWPGASVQRVF